MAFWNRCLQERLQSAESVDAKEPLETKHSSRVCSVEQCGAAWMSFQKHRGAPVGTAMSWPISKPAGLSSVELGYNRRAVSTTESQYGNLPPITNNTRPGNRKAMCKADMHDKGRESWANNWANVRAQQTNVYYTNGTTKNRERNYHIAAPLASWKIRSARKKNHVVAMSEKEEIMFKRLKGIYANSTDKSLRTQRLQNTINSLQSRTLHAELQHSLKDFKTKMEDDKRNRSELKRVRDRYSRDKERRQRYSYVSLNALECPQVSRHAYGLPEEGRERRKSSVFQSAEKQLFCIWEKAVKRAANVSKLVRSHEEKELFSEVTVKRQPQVPKRSREEPRKDSTTLGTTHQLELILGEADVLSTGLSESEDDDLLDTEDDN